MRDKNTDKNLPHPRVKLSSNLLSDMVICMQFTLTVSCLY